MIIGKEPHRQRIQFVPLGETLALDKSDSDSLEADNSDWEEFYTDDYSDNEVRLYEIETIPKEKNSPHRKILAKRRNENPVLSNNEIGWRLNQIWLGQN